MCKITTKYTVYELLYNCIGMALNMFYFVIHSIQKSYISHIIFVNMYMVIILHE
jgi:hypothetical protein